MGCTQKYANEPFLQLEPDFLRLERDRFQPKDYVARIPRSIKLLLEYENATKAQENTGVNLGLHDSKDPTLTKWDTCIIPDPRSKIADRFYNLEVLVPTNYPEDPPQIRFTQRVSMPCVNNQGYVMLYQ